MRTRVKICGITRPEDGLTAAHCGADAIGLVFHPASPRAVTPETANRIIAALPAFVTISALFVDPSADEVEQILNAVPVDLLQFHGDEAPSFCRYFGRRYIKGIRMRDDVDLQMVAERYHDCAAVLLDAYRPGVAGGTGERFDHSRVPHDYALPVILAGGLAPENVADAVRTVRPWAVDVSTGVEQGKGIKDPDKIERFMRGVQRVQTE